MSCAGFKTASIDAVEDTSSARICSVPFALSFMACNLVAVSGVRHVARTMLVGDARSWRVSSSPIPRDALQKKPQYAFSFVHFDVSVGCTHPVMSQEVVSEAMGDCS